MSQLKQCKYKEIGLTAGRTSGSPAEKNLRAATDPDPQLKTSQQSLFMTNKANGTLGCIRKKNNKPETGTNKRKVTILPLAQYW